MISNLVRIQFNYMYLDILYEMRKELELNSINNTLLAVVIYSSNSSQSIIIWYDKNPFLF